MTSELYRRTLRSARWRQLKQRRLMLCGYRCEDCGQVYPYKRARGALGRYFHLHHRYEVGAYDRVGRETLDDVRILCPACHLKPGRHPWHD